ncbi:hypothetical protein GXW83_10815 [Streptacidiphilus sp. PB12-B1b]|uniref:hypothetical protein n=1 Tax=Streptacidiphilus sp. PB12-B1b TaxID=2705012 RepID=UPI0015FB45BC|nr:hypothetical protein [Streptacidiphilus sp. PB12-B1b]QMU76156.1 hypothetical protein GXW83_10815 [Streptacidiphilus sp. PB12-B1b]
MTKRQFASLVATVAALTALAGCAAHGQVAQIAAAPAATAAATPAADPTRTATAAVLAAYTGMRQAQEQAEAAGTTQNVSLGSYATGKALVQISAAVGQNAAQDWVMVGLPVLDPKVTALDLAAAPPTATVTDCMNVSGWHLVDEFTGKDVTAPSAHASFVSVSQAQLGPDGWRITQTDVDRSRPC